MTADVVQTYLDSRSRLALPAQRCEWVGALRRRAGERLLEVGLPTSRAEDWKYTNTRPLQRRAFTPATAAHNGVAQEHLQALAPLDSVHRAVFVNGQFSASLSQLDELPTGVRVAGLAAALEDEDALLREQLGQVAPAAAHGFIALNTAYLQDGALVDIGAGCQAERPIELLFVCAARDEGLAVQPRNLIRAAANSRATVIERYLAVAEGEYLTNAVTEIVAEPGADLTHYKLQQESPAAYHMAGLYITQAASSRVVSNNVALGGAIARTDLQVSLAAPGAHCVLNGLYLGSGRQHIDNHTQIDHLQPDCVSDEFYKGVLSDRARGVFHGRIVVHEDAQRTDARQQNKNLLLSKDAEVDTKPQLEIYADDVKCSHGATVGQLDADAVYYLRTRGIDEGSARRLLTYAFANDVLGRIELEAVRRQLEHELTHKLFHVDRIEEIA